MVLSGDPDLRWKMTAGLAVLGLLALVVTGSMAGLAATGLSGAGLPPVGWLASILKFTAWQAVLSTLLSVGLAIPVALALARQNAFVGRLWLIRLMAVPLALPVLVGAFAILGIWGRRGLVNDLLLASGLVAEPVSIYGLTGILLAHVFFNLPLAARFLLAALERIPAEQFKLAASLGMTRTSQFRFIEWPAIARVLPSISALVFMLCATSFTLVLVLGGGPSATTLEVAIYQSLRLDYAPAQAALLSVLQIALSAGAWFAVSRLAARPDEGTALSGHPILRLDNLSLAIRFADAIVLAVFAIVLLAPLAEILRTGLAANPLTLLAQEQVRQALLTSLMVAASSGLACVAAGLVLMEARLMAGSGRPVLRALLLVAPATTLLVPALALSTGWFVLMTMAGVVDQVRVFFVILFNAMMALPFAVNALEPALSAHHHRHDRLAASLGLSGPARLRILDWPVLRKPVLAALSFAAALSMGDLGVIALFGGDGFVTLPSLLHARLGSYRSQDAAGLALILATLALLLAIPAARLERGSDVRP